MIIKSVEECAELLTKEFPFRVLQLTVLFIKLQLYTRRLGFTTVASENTPILQEIHLFKIPK